MEVAVCNVCRARYEDKESVELVKKWQKDGYAPCPNISCRGEMVIKEETNDNAEAYRGSQEVY